jgi:spore coat protein H
MKRVGGDEKSGQYQGQIAGLNAGQLVRFTITALDRQKTVRIHPNPNDVRPTFSVFSQTNRSAPLVSKGWVIQTGPTEKPGRSMYNNSRNSSKEPAGDPTRGNAAFVYFNAQKNGWDLFDHVRTTPRKGGLKVRFLKDQLLKEMSTINLVFEASPRHVLAEHLAYELYRISGVPTPHSEHIRMYRNGAYNGYYLMVEQPNKAFLSHNGRNESGNLYKLLWYGEDLVSKHEKKTNLKNGHGDLQTLVEGLRKRTGPAQWEWIQTNFNVDEFINYYVVNMCIQNWDGFFNNFFIYHDLGGTKKWEIYPWDEDKTWGDFDGASPDYDWYSLPLNFGMNGATAPSRWGRDEGPWGGPSWWRPPGYLSGPLLANPQFRARFLARLKVFTEEHFTPEKMNSLIDQLEKKLLPEIKFQAQSTGEGGNRALQEFKNNIQSFRNQAEERRRFILAELPKQK